MLVNDGLFGAPLFLDAILLQLFELSGVGFMMIAETAFLQGQVLELLFIEELDFGVDESVAFSRVGFGAEEIGLFEAGDGEYAGFERSDAVNAPFGIGDELNETIFLVGCGRPMIEDTFNEGLIDDGVFCGEQNSLAGESGFQGVHARFCLAGLGAWTRAVLGVGAVGSETGVGEGAGFGGGWRDEIEGGGNEVAGLAADGGGPGLGGEVGSFALGGATDGTV